MLTRFKQKRVPKNEKYLTNSPIFNISGGLDFRFPAIELQGNVWSDAKNVIIKNKDVSQRPGYVTYGNNIPLASNPIMAFDYFFDYDGTQYLFAWSTKEIYQYNSSSGMWECVTYGAVIQDCEDKTDWTASANITVTDDTTNRVVGTNALKIAVAAAFGTGITSGIACYYDFTATNLTAYTYLHLWIKSSVATSAGDIQILLDDTAGCVSPLETLDIPALVADTLTEVEVEIGTPGDLTAVSSVAVKIATDGDLLREDCSDISDWVNGDNINGVSEVDPAGQFRMDANTAAWENCASRYRLLTSVPDQFTFETRLYHDALGTRANMDYFHICFYQTARKFHVFFSTDGLKIGNDSGEIEVGTNLVKSGGSAEWQTWRFVVDLDIGTCDVYLDDSTHTWEKVGDGIACVLSEGGSAGYVWLLQTGFTTNDMVTHVDYIKAQTGSILGAMNIYVDDIRVVKRLTGSVDYEVSNEQIYSETRAANLFISTNRVNDIQCFEPGTDTVWSDLGGSPNKCKFLKNFHNHLMRFDVVSGGARYPVRIEWSAHGEPEDNTSSGSGNNSLIKSMDWLTGCEIIKGNLAIFKEESITMCYYVGGANPFEFDENKIYGLGTPAGKTIKSRDGEELVFLGSDMEVYTFDGYDVERRSKFLNYKLADKIDSSNVNLCHAEMYEEFASYVLYAPKVGSDYCDSVWVWNYHDDYWTYWELNDDIMSSGFYVSITALKIGEILGKIGTLDWRIGSRTISANFPTILLGNETGYIFNLLADELNDNSVAIDSYFTTKSHILNEVQGYTRHEYIASYAKGNDIEIEISTDDGMNFVNKGSVSLDLLERNNKFLRNLKTTSEKLMIRFRNKVTNERFHLSGYSIGYIKKDRIID